MRHLGAIPRLVVPHRSRPGEAFQHLLSDTLVGTYKKFQAFWCARRTLHPTAKPDQVELFSIRIRTAFNTPCFFRVPSQPASFS